MDRTKRLLSHGYFPSQLPPCFKTRDLADHYSSLYNDWLSLQVTPKNGVNAPKAPSSKAELFSVARAGHQRRVTSLPNPIAQTYISKHITQHWGDLLKHYRQSRLSASHPRFLKSGSRAANIPSMQLLYERKVLEAAGYRYMLKTDISRFFPTIYTHSVPWALHGKALSKRNRKITSRFFGNLLDLSLRQGQDEQTIGLPIGPDTSHIIAEAIATAVDLEFKKRLKNFPAGFRYVDDYFMFFATAHEAEAALAALIRSLKEFELQINFEKTKTCSVIEITDDYWTHQLRSLSIANSGRRQASDINHFFELAKDLARRNLDENVITYALKRVSSVLVRKENWNSFEAHVCHVAMAYPNTLQTVARLLSTYARVGYPINQNRLQRMINAVVQDHAQLGHHSEVAWCLWICKDLNLKLNDSNIDLISEMHSSVCALILLDLCENGKLSKLPKHTYWRQFENTESLYGDLWLLSYEAGIRGWAGFSNSHIVQDKYFSLALNKNVHFYDENATLIPIFHAKSDVLENRKIATLADLFDLDDIDDLIEYEQDNGGYENVIFEEEEEEEEEENNAEKTKTQDSKIAKNINDIF